MESPPVPSADSPGDDARAVATHTVPPPARHLLEQAPVAPMDVDGLSATVLGLVAFGIGIVVTALFHDSLAAGGNGWWLGVCISGFALGWVGLAYCLHRRNRRRAGRWDRD